MYLFYIKAKVIGLGLFWGEWGALGKTIHHILISIVLFFLFFQGAKLTEVIFLHHIQRKKTTKKQGKLLSERVFPHS